MGVEPLGRWWEAADRRMASGMAAAGIPILRVSLAVVFIWFGLLKLTGHSPVVALIAHTVDWWPPDVFVPVLGLWEVAVGFGLLFKIALRLTLLLFWLQLAGTFSVLLLRPEIAFQAGHPLLLTVEGEFVVKNLVLIAAGLVIGGTVRQNRQAVDHEP